MAGERRIAYLIKEPDYKHYFSKLPFLQILIAIVDSAFLILATKLFDAFNELMS